MLFIRLFGGVSACESVGISKAPPLPYLGTFNLGALQLRVSPVPDGSHALFHSHTTFSILMGSQPLTTTATRKHSLYPALCTSLGASSPPRGQCARERDVTGKVCDGHLDHSVTKRNHESAAAVSSLLDGSLRIGGGACCLVVSVMRIPSPSSERSIERSRRSSSSHPRSRSAGQITQRESHVGRGQTCRL